MPPQTSLPIDQTHTLLTSLHTFLLLSTHNILFYRHLYPQETFLSTKAFNLPIHQSRHPKLCQWITDAFSQVSTQLSLGTVSTVSIVIHSPSTTQKILERYVFDLSRLPKWPGTRNHPNPADSFRVHGNRVMATDFRQEKARDNYLDSFNYSDINEQYRACLKRMAHAMEKMDPLPEGCGFTIAIELKEEGKAPIGHPQEWIPIQPSLQPSGSASSSQGKDLGGVKITAVRSIEAGPLFIECWIEEGEAKAAFLKEHEESSSQQEDSERWR
ncbi:DNA-binding protein [Podospora fimiseda]|uniref:DNA-binding protein n=1 Tax=Podospora fimiseda TaxID=252190 RepID=A0AAN7BJA2_9PEZI|nr:DNA-binding protein [Podospora fimiseda]